MKPNTQARESPILARARWIFSHRRGLDCSIGIPLASNIELIHYEAFKRLAS